MEPIALQYYIEQVATLGDTVAFEKLFYYYHSKIKRFALAITRNNELAEEATSDLFVNIWKNRTSLLEIENLNSYLYISIKNIALRKISQNKQQFDVLEMTHLDLSDITPSPEDILLNKEIIKHIDEAINSLPQRCRTIYRLAKQDGLRYKEIASILNLSVKTIDAQMAIAVKRITKALKYNFQRI